MLLVESTAVRSLFGGGLAVAARASDGSSVQVTLEELRPCAVLASPHALDLLPRRACAARREQGRRGRTAEFFSAATCTTVCGDFPKLLHVS